MPKPSDDQHLSRMQRHVIFERGTEPPFSGEYVDHDKAGVYRCANCGAVLFDSASKFESETPGLVGWPAFTSAATQDSLTLKRDLTHGMSRVEMLCKNCGGHIGHLFDDPLSPNGAHYCANSCALAFEAISPSDDDQTEWQAK